MTLFPAFLKLEGRRCLVVGAGIVAQGKIPSLLRAGAKVQVVAPEATERIQNWARAKKVTWERRPFREEDLDGVFLVIAATPSSELHAQIQEESRRRGVLCNAVDDPAHCDFFYGAVVRRGGLLIAISTSGRSPALAQRIRKKLEREFSEEYAVWVEEIGAVRERLLKKKLSRERRVELLHRLASTISFEEFLRRSSRKRKTDGT
jgi:precorrin-2 dehydrogenase/sirohydrochlorin ferrochelatase